MKIDLTELKKRLHARSTLAITLESGRLAISMMRYDGDETKVAQSLSLPLGEEEVLKNPEKAGQELAAALSAASIRERRCVVCLPAGWALTASTDLPEVGVEDLRGYLELRAEREFTIPAADLRLGYCAYALPNGQRRATLAAMPAKKIEAVEKMLGMANRKAESISLALDKVLTQPKAMLHFLTNGTHTDVVVTAGGGIAGLRSLPGPLTTGETTFDPVAFCRDVRITLGRLPEPVRQQVRSAAFSGPSAQRLCVATRFNLSRMGIESPECGDAPGTAVLPPDALGAAVEAARSQLLAKPIPFEFVVPETKKWQVLLHQVDSKKRRQLAIAAAVVVFLPVILFFIRSEIEGHLQNEWNGMSRTVSELDGLQSKIRQFRPWFEGSPQGLQVFSSLAAAFPDTGEVWVKSVQVAEGDKVTCTGFARSQSAFLALREKMRAQPDITALQVQQVRGDNPIQFVMTYQWEPQHD